MCNLVTRWEGKFVLFIWGLGYERIYGWKSKNRGVSPKWMVKIMENPIVEWMIWGYHYFRKHPYIFFWIHFFLRSFHVGSGSSFTVLASHFCLPNKRAVNFDYCGTRNARKTLLDSTPKQQWFGVGCKDPESFETALTDAKEVFSTLDSL